MIRRSTLVFLTCLGVMGAPAIHAQSVQAQSTQTQGDNSPTLLSQTPGSSIDADVLSIGSTGPAVRALQARLSDAGYYSGPLDGIYGLATQRAVIAFQDGQGLEATGRVDNETLDTLESFELAPEEGTSAESLDNSPANVEAGSEPQAVPVEDAPSDAAVATAESERGGLGRVFGLGLALAALAASFGVGFFIANRGKEDLEETGDAEEWGEAESPMGIPNGQKMAGSALAQSQNGTQSASQSGFADAGIIAPVSASLQATGQMGGTSALAPVEIVDGLIKDLHNPDPSRRRKVIWELGQRGNSLAVQPLVDAMVSADSKEKSLVLAALSEIGIRSLKPMNRALAIALKDDNPEVRKNAIRDLTRIYELVVQISQMLGHATEDEDPEVRQTASWALEQLNRIRRVQDVDSNMRSFSGGNGPTLRAMGQGQ
ncbi:MAG: peptidoglycan-binding protein [Cyanobacteria bacterium J06581_3]